LSTEAQKARKREKDKRFREKRRESLLAKAKQYYERNRERLLATMKHNFIGRRGTTSGGGTR